MTDGFALTGAWRADVIKDFAQSELFDRTFQEGMDLVEETAGYLDGSGRQESKLLSRSAALAYAAESMRLTTRLMQVASWLLVQRAVREGDMAPAAACEDRYRLNADDQVEVYYRYEEGIFQSVMALTKAIRQEGKFWSPQAYADAYKGLTHDSQRQNLKKLW